MTCDDCTIATRAERRCSPDFRAGYWRVCHGEPPSVALATGSLAGPVQVVLSHALSFLREVPGLYRQRRESRRLRSSTSRSSIFVVVGLLSRGYAPSSASVLSRMPARLRGTHYRRTYVLSPILGFLENDSRHTFLV